MSRCAMSRMHPAIPCGLRLSLHSPQPTSPPSVSIRTNVHGLQPPSQCSASTRAIFMRVLSRTSYRHPAYDRIPRSPREGQAIDDTDHVPELAAFARPRLDENTVEKTGRRATRKESGQHERALVRRPKLQGRGGLRLRGPYCLD